MQFTEQDSENEVKGLSGWIDDLSEKRAATRLNALDSILTILRKQVDCEIGDFSETLSSHLKSALRKGKGEEFDRACSVLQVLGFHCDAQDGKALWNEFESVLNVFCLPEGVSSEKTEHGVVSLAILCFLFNEEQEKLIQVMKIMQTLIEAPIADAAKIATLKGWGLLCTALEFGYIQENWEDLINVLTPQLNHQHLDVRVEAGENLALLLAVSESLQEDETTNGEPKSKEVSEQGIVVENEDAFLTKKTIEKQQHQKFNDDNYFIVEQLVQSLEELSSDTSSHRNKQRIRTIVNVVRDGDQLEEKIVLDKVTIPLDNWIDIKRLSIMKEVLKDGFATHFKENVLLHQIFDIESRGIDQHLFGSKIVNTDGRIYYSTNSLAAKNQTLERNKARQKKQDQQQQQQEVQQ